jgi:hypothetical protein
MQSLQALLEASLDDLIRDVKSTNPNWMGSKHTVLQMEAEAAKDEFENSRGLDVIRVAGRKFADAKKAYDDYEYEVIHLQSELLDYIDLYDIDINRCANAAKDHDRIGYTENDTEFWEKALAYAKQIHGPAGNA